jgi:dipeptidyl aminopeptidase/acylaminoacyl peptidase
MSGDRPGLTAELIVDGAAPQQPAISPDGRWVVYVAAPVSWGGERRLSALWVAAADGSSAPRTLTAGTANDSGPRWAPDSASLYFLSDRAGSVQLYRIQLDGGEAEALTSWRGDISDVCPLADGRLAAVAATDEEHERRHAERDDAVLWGEQLPRSRLRLLDVSTGQIRVVRGLGDRHVVELAQRPDGGPLAVIRWASPEIDPGVFTNELHAIDPPTGAVRDLGRIEASASSPAWWRDGGSWHLTYLASPDRTAATLSLTSPCPPPPVAGSTGT